MIRGRRIRNSKLLQLILEWRPGNFRANARNKQKISDGERPILLASLKLCRQRMSGSSDKRYCHFGCGTRETNDSRAFIGDVLKTTANLGRKVSRKNIPNAGESRPLTRECRRWLNNAAKR